MARDLRKKKGFIATHKFSVEESKSYLMAGIISFHILPLFFVFMGEAGQQILITLFLTTMNPLIIFSICTFHAFRLGFCVKFPLIMTFLGALSIAMYYNYLAGAVLTSTLIFGIVYLVLCFASELLGGFLKKFIGG